MTPPDTPTLSLTIWLKSWRALAAVHRYRVEGLDTLRTRRPCLIVGYHGRPLAWDLCMLTARLHDELGYLPHGVLHGSFGHGPLQKVADDLGFVTADGPAVAQAVARGEHVLVAPGGTREGCRGFGDRYRVDWGERVGYLRLALRHGLPIVPVAAAGVDDLYLGLNHGDRWGRRLHVPARLPFWLGVGPLGLWPWSPPFPVQIRQKIGDPIELRALGMGDPHDRAGLLAAHRQVTAAVQGLLDGLQRA